MNKYGFHVAWSDEDEGFIATSVEFPGLSAFGETAEASLHEAEVALGLFIKTYQEEGRELPPPQALQQYSGQTRLRIPKDLHRQAALIAAASEVSLNQYIVDAVRLQVIGKQFGSEVLREVREHLAQAETVAASVKPAARSQVRRTETTLREVPRQTTPKRRKTRHV